MWWCCAHISVSGNGPDWCDSRAITAESGAASSAAPLERRRADNRAFSASFGPLVPQQTKPSDFGCIPACVGAVLRSVLVGMGRTGMNHGQSRPKAVLEAVQGLWNAGGPIAARSLRCWDLWHHNQRSKVPLGACGHVVVLWCDRDLWQCGVVVAN